MKTIVRDCAATVLEAASLGTILGLIMGAVTMFVQELLR
jgi:hypothetical protein